MLLAWMFTDLLDSTFAGWSFTGFNFCCIFLVCLLSLLCACVCCVCMLVLCVCLCVCLCVSVVKGVRSLCFLLLLYSYDMYGLKDVWYKRPIAYLLLHTTIAGFRCTLKHCNCTCVLLILYTATPHTAQTFLLFNCLLCFRDIRRLAFLWWCGGVFVVVWLCFRGCVFVILFLWWCGGVFVARSVGEESY